jgi:hypothetical protein
VRVKTLMALLGLAPSGSCSVCGHLVSASVSSCPACGAVPRWRHDHRSIPRAPLIFGLVLIGALVVVLASRLPGPARPAAPSTAEVLREAKRVSAPHPPGTAMRSRIDASQPPRSGPGGTPPGLATLAGVMGVCLAASVAVGSLALVVNRRRRRAADDVVERDAREHRAVVRLAYACAGACLGVALSVAIVLTTQARVAPPGSPEQRDRIEHGLSALPARPPLVSAQPRPVGPEPRREVRAAARLDVPPVRAQTRPAEPPVAASRPSATPVATAAVLAASPSVVETAAEPEVSASPADPAESSPTASEPEVVEPARTATTRLDTAVLQDRAAGEPDRPITASREPDHNLIDKIRSDWKTITGQAKSDVGGVVHGLRRLLGRD